MVLLHVFTHDCTCTQALEAADKLLFTREAIVGVAAKHGLEASFVPKMSSSAAGCGCHCHLSLWKVRAVLGCHWDLCQSVMTLGTKQSEARYDDIAVGWVAMRELGVPSFVAWSSRQA
eukprot:1157342-Pelagomonas_calceolata.AAC.9